MGPKSSDKYPYQKPKRRHRNTGESHVKTEVETREMLPQAKEHQGSPERDKERFFPRAGSGNTAANTLISDF